VKIAGIFVAVSLVFGPPIVGAASARTGKLYRTPDGVISLVAPSDWEPTDAFQNPSASIKLAHPGRAGFAMVISEHKKDFKAGLALEDYARIVLSLEKKKPFQSVTISEPTHRVINGNKAIQYELHITYHDVNTFHVQTFYETRTRFSQVLCWTVPSALDRERGDFDVMIESFKQRPMPPAQTQPVR
jgi:hypothetical protein